MARLRGARRLTILTGAGVSAASGVPTFRGAEGLWRRFRPEELATADAFRRDSKLVWEWYAWRRVKIAACEPNAAHRVIAQWSQAGAWPWSPPAGGRFQVITQNVDDLHLRAGTRNLVRLHGSIWEMSCWNDCGQPRWRDESTALAAGGPEEPSLPGASESRPHPSHAGTLPACPACGGLARPAVVWFGESLAADDVAAALEATNCDLFLTVGTSALVYPAAGLVHEARRRGAFTAEINLDETPASAAVDVAIRGAAEDVLPRLMAGWRDGAAL